MLEAIFNLVVNPALPSSGAATRGARRNRSHRPRLGSARAVESLEQRQLLAVVAGTSSATEQVVPLYQALTATNSQGTVTALATSGPTGYTPAQIRQAYGVNQITFNGGTVAGDGSGTTIAIVDAYSDPNIASDLQHFDAQFGLANPTLTTVNQFGGSSLPSGDTGWATEIALDVEWAHAIAPKANILLVEANSSSLNDLLTAVNYARNATGVVAVSMSWGGSEFFGQTNYDGSFTTPAGHTGVAFFVASGDSGAPAEYPAASPNVVSVGGTSLYLNSQNSISSETAWSGSTGGLSSYETQPGYQQGVVTQSTTRRAIPDVSYDANPSTGFPVYDSYGTSSPWGQYGGTSDAAPQWAALVAIADQGRALNGLSALSGSQLLTALYQLPASDFHDITSGGSSGNPALSTSAGYDLVTGRGSPQANLIVSALAGSSTTTSVAATHLSVSAPSSVTAGGTLSIAVSALTSSNAAASSYTGTIHFSSTDIAAGLPADYTFTAADQGVHTFTGLRLTTAGSQTITASDRSSSSINGKATTLISAAAASQWLFAQQPSSAVAGATISPAVTVKVEDAYGNLVANDSTDQVSLSLGANPSGGSLSGMTTAIVTGGVATFNNLAINLAGNGYTLFARGGTLTGATSNGFNVTANAVVGSSVIEGFESGTLSAYKVVNGTVASASVSASAAHDGSYGLLDSQGTDWIYRNDSAAQVKAGESISVWLQFSGQADGRAYLGFGASASGTLSLIAAANTNQLLLQDNRGYGYTDLAAVGQTFAPNHWYRLQVDWNTGGSITGKLFDSNGTTLLQTLSATDTTVTSGGIAFRGFGSSKLWDTVSVSQLATSAAQSVSAIATGTTSSTSTPYGRSIAQAWFESFAATVAAESASSLAATSYSFASASATTSRASQRGVAHASLLSLEELLLDDSTISSIAKARFARHGR